MQETARLRELPLKAEGEAALFIEPFSCGDHYTYRPRQYETFSARVVRVYSYVTGEGGIDPDSVRDITPRVRVVQASVKGVRVAIECGPQDQGRTACVIAAFGLFTPDVFAPTRQPRPVSVLTEGNIL